MRLIILTQYFPPEVGAPQNRLYELAIRLHHAGVEVVVLTAMPNYPQMVIHPEYRGKRYVHEKMGPLDVHRARIYVSSTGGFIARLRNYFSFVWSSYWVGKRKLPEADFLMVESPPLFLGMSAIRLARLKKARMIFNVSDLWPESAEKLGIVSNKALLGMAYRLEARLYKKSGMVTGQTMGIVKSVNKRFPDVKTLWLPNGVDAEYYNPEKYGRNWRKEEAYEDHQNLFIYAGIIGHAQGLDVIIKAANILKDRKDICFILLGNGPEKKRLQHMAEEMQLSQLRFFDAVDKKQMPTVISACDAAIIPLRRLDIFKGAIPSKIFENAAMCKPILLGVEGEAHDLFIEQARAGLPFEPENPVDLARAVIYMAEHKEEAAAMGSKGRAYVSKFFNRSHIADSFLMTLKKIQQDG